MRYGTGPVAAALRRHDPNLRVRWSYERKKWAVEERSKKPNAILPPVFFARMHDQADWWEERLLPELSDRYICYRDKTHVICWAKTLNWSLYRAIVQRDSHRMRHRMVGEYDRRLAADAAIKEKAIEQRRAARVDEAWDLFKFHLRHNPNAEDGTGVSIKGLSAVYG